MHSDELASYVEVRVTAHDTVLDTCQREERPALLACACGERQLRARKRRQLSYGKSV